MEAESTVASAARLAVGCKVASPSCEPVKDGWPAKAHSVPHHNVLRLTASLATGRGFSFHTSRCCSNGEWVPGLGLKHVLGFFSIFCFTSHYLWWMSVEPVFAQVTQAFRRVCVSVLICSRWVCVDSLLWLKPLQTSGVGKILRMFLRGEWVSVCECVCVSERICFSVRLEWELSVLLHFGLSAQFPPSTLQRMRAREHWQMRLNADGTIKSKHNCPAVSLSSNSTSSQGDTRPGAFQHSVGTTGLFQLPMCHFWKKRVTCFLV